MCDVGAAIALGTHKYPGGGVDGQRPDITANQTLDDVAAVPLDQLLGRHIDCAVLNAAIIAS